MSSPTLGVPPMQDPAGLLSGGVQTPQPQQQQAQQPASVVSGKPNPFEGILKGALMGMAAASAGKQDFFGGMGRAFQAQQQQSQQDSDNEYRDQQMQLAQQKQQQEGIKNSAQSDLDHANAAKAMVDLLHTEALMKQMPVEAQQKMAESFGKTMDAWHSAGYQGVEIEDIPQARQAYIQQMQTDGIKPGDVIFAPDPNNGKTIALRYDPAKRINGGTAQTILKGFGVDVPPVDMDSQVFNSLVAGGARKQAEQMSQDHADKRADAANATRLAAAHIAATGGANDDDIKTIGDGLHSGAVTLDEIPNFAKVKPQVEAYVLKTYPGDNLNEMMMTSQDRNRASLAKNADGNLSIIENALKADPKLIGQIQGHVTELMAGKIGTNDPQLGTIVTALDNYAKASTGAHNLRSKQALIDTKLSLLNDFKNGAPAVNASIQTAHHSLWQLQHPHEDESKNPFKAGPEQGNGNPWRGATQTGPQ